tara:strand:+ start:659 stop:1465 length:807 start_codon:yes stop_codon:yes gene_type:complete
MYSLSFYKRISIQPLPDLVWKKIFDYSDLETVLYTLSKVSNVLKNLVHLYFFSHHSDHPICFEKAVQSHFYLKALPPVIIHKDTLVFTLSSSKKLIISGSLSSSHRYYLKNKEKTILLWELTLQSTSFQAKGYLNDRLYCTRDYSDVSFSVEHNNDPALTIKSKVFKLVKISTGEVVWACLLNSFTTYIGCIKNNQYHGFATSMCTQFDYKCTGQFLLDQFTGYGILETLLETIKGRFDNSEPIGPTIKVDRLEKKITHTRGNGRRLN